MTTPDALVTAFFTLTRSATTIVQSAAPDSAQAALDSLQAATDSVQAAADSLQAAADSLAGDSIPHQGLIEIGGGPGWLRALFDPHVEIAGARIGMDEVFVFVLIVSASYFISRIVQRLVKRWFALRKSDDPGIVANTNRLIHYIALTIGIALGLHAIGINLGGLFAAGAVLAVGIGFATQNLTQNFVSGVLLLAERSITEGDVLEVQGEMVRVERLGARATVARTRDDEQLIIPNATLVQSTVTNYTLQDDLFRVRSQVGVSYDSNLDHVMTVLQKVAEELPGRSQARDPSVLLLAFADSAVVFEISVWSRNPWTMLPLRSDILMRVWRALHEEDIVIAYPQMDLHVKSWNPKAGMPAAVRRGETESASDE